MSQGLREITVQELNAAIEEVLLPRLSDEVSARQAGHCMRVSNLDRELMVRLCGGLRAAVPQATIVVLADDALRQVAPDLTVTSTKLVELRNPLPNNELRPPLLVFVPNELRASAEDSFGVATFEEVDVGGVYAHLRRHLVDQLPASIRSAITSVLAALEREDAPWAYADDLSVSRFLLTAKANDYDPEAIGAALFELALVPDFELMSRPEAAPGRGERNRRCVETITWSTRSERARALELELADGPFANRLADFFTKADLSDPRAWCRQIVRDRSNWQLAFNRWQFADGGSDPDSIYIGDVVLLDVPTISMDADESKLQDLKGQRVLVITKSGPRKLSVSFRVDPVPSRVAGLTHFRAELVSRDNGATGLRRRKKAWSKPSDSGTISFSLTSKIEWEEGWHFVRIIAVTADGERIPLVDRGGNPVQGINDVGDPSLSPNESDPFYVLCDEDLEVETPQRAVPRERSLMHAVLKAKFNAVAQGRDPRQITWTGRNWADRHGKSASLGSETIEVRLGKEGRANVIVSGALAAMERELLSNPAEVNRIKLSISSSGLVEWRHSSFSWPLTPETTRFLAAREFYFNQVYGEDEHLILQGADLTLLTDSISEYSSAYTSWLRAAEARANSGDDTVSRGGYIELRSALSIDTVTVSLDDYRGRRREAVLLGPTHPLRAVWHCAWAAVAQEWLEQSIASNRRFVLPTRDAVLTQLTPSGFPVILPLADELGRSAIAVDDLDAFWSLYAPGDEADPRGLLGDVAAALSLSDSSLGGSQIDSDYLAERVRRYLVQHPYVRTLRINAFNAGRAAAVSQLLLAIQRQPSFGDLRYDVRIFVPDANAPGAGGALEQLLFPDATTTSREADAFSLPTESHLHPKLRVAVRSIDEFRRAPEQHSAHLSFLFDLFPPEEIRSAQVNEEDEYASVGGLVQPYHVDYLEDEQSVTWLRRPVHGAVAAGDSDSTLTDLLLESAKTVSTTSVGVATGIGLPHSRPVVALALSSTERAMLHQVHDVSDWVFTVDRNLGIEFFDHRHNSTRPDYLIDHSPDIANASTHRVAITSRSLEELEAHLAPVLAHYRLPNSRAHAIVLLDQLRSLSGRLALKLLSSPTQRAEAMGLALSRLYLEHQGVFLNQIVVPLDAHLDLYRDGRTNAFELGDEISFRRTDLGLFDLDPASRVITCRLVEVKCYSQVGDLGAYGQLKESVARQIKQSEEVLSSHFDPGEFAVDRPDRALKNRELAGLLEFYLQRSERYGLVTPDAALDIRTLLHDLDRAPYRLEFTRSALIFDFEKPGTEEPERDSGIEFHRIGRDLITDLVEACVNDSESSAAINPRALSVSEITAELHKKQSLAPSVPTLDTAAFLSPPRARPSEARATDSEESKAVAAVPAPRPDAVAESPREYDSGHRPSSTLEPVAAAIEPAPSTPPIAPPDPDRRASFDVMLGSADSSPQYGLVGETLGRRVALDLNETHTISLFGVQGGGKSYTLGSIVEMSSMPISGINVLPKPLGTVIFHYSPTMDYKPEFTSMVSANDEPDQVSKLVDIYGATAHGLKDIVLLVPKDKLDERRLEYPHLEVIPLSFSASELKASHWKFLMGAVGNQAVYIRQLMRVMKSMRDEITIDGLRHGIDTLSVPEHIKDIARMRLDLAEEYVDDASNLTSLLRPGRLVIVDLRDEFIDKDEALGLFVVLLQLFAEAKFGGTAFNKLVVFDEAHKYIESPDLVDGLIEVVREMRHKGVSILVASQDPPSVPVSLIELSSQIILHKFNSPAWLKHIQKANAALVNVTPDRMAALSSGEAYVWSSKASDESFSKGAIKIRCRPRVTLHGGSTRLAVSPADG